MICTAPLACGSECVHAVAATHSQVVNGESRPTPANGCAEVNDAGSEAASSDELSELSNLLAPLTETMCLPNDLAIQGISASIVDSLLFEQAKPLLINELRRYPREVLRKNLGHIILCANLQFQNVPASGTYFGNDIYISIDTGARGGNMRELDRTLHHELSSVLLRNNTRYFPFHLFVGCNVQGFEYSDNLVGVLNDKSLLVLYDSAQGKEGFLTRYSRVSLEDDVNVIAEELFTNPQSLFNYAEEHDRVFCKIRAFVFFLHELDYRFEETALREKKELYEVSHDD
jgi:hypothetical protein